MSLQDPNVLNPQRRKRVAIVIANPAVSTTTGWPVGFWWSELTHPYHAFVEAGYEVAVFSPVGGPCAADGMSDPNDASGYSKTDLISQGFIRTPELKALVDNTRKVADLDVAAFDAIVVAGGQAPMFSFEGATDLPFFNSSGNARVEHGLHDRIDRHRKTLANWLQKHHASTHESGVNHTKAEGTKYATSHHISVRNVF